MKAPNQSNGRGLCVRVRATLVSPYSRSGGVESHRLAVSAGNRPYALLALAGKPSNQCACRIHAGCHACDRTKRRGSMNSHSDTLKLGLFLRTLEGASISSIKKTPHLCK